MTADALVTEPVKAAARLVRTIPLSAQTRKVNDWLIDYDTASDRPRLNMNSTLGCQIDV